MRLRADERGVTVQIGTVLLFAVLILLLSIYQASVVPQQNEQVEFNHNERVQGQLQDLRDELHRTAVTGSVGSSSVALGTRYPARAVFVNPSPPSGSLRTTSLANATIRNATARGEVGDYWDGENRQFSTRGLVYEPNYNVYQNPPTTVYRNGVLYKQFDGANRTLGGQQLIHGNTISLVALNGSLSKSASGSTTVDLQAVSAATRTVTIRNASADENVTLVLPTRLPKEKAAGQWRALLDGEQRVQRVAPGTEANTVRIVLEPGTYELELAKVGVGTDVTGVGPHYVTDVRGDNATVDEDSERELVVEVRDRYNNPVSGATVNATLVGGLANDAVAAQGQSGTTLTNLTTDGEGRVTVTYDAPADFDGPNRAVELRVSTNVTPGPGSFDPDTRANLTLELTAVNADGSGLGGAGGDGAYQTLWNRSAIDDEPGMTCYAANNTCRYDRSVASSVTLTAETSPVADGARIDFAVNDTAVGTFNVSDRTTTGTGRAQVSLDTQQAGAVSAYTWSGGTGDALGFEIYESGGGGGPGNDPPVAEFTFACTDLTCSFDGSGSYDPEGNIRNYAWEFGDDTTGTGETTNHTYDSAGTYTVTLTVTDNNGQTNSTSKTVNVSADGASPNVGFRVDDLTHVDTDSLSYLASYSVTNANASFQRVSVVYDNVGRGPSATGIRNSTSARGSLQYDLNYGTDEEWNVTVRVVYEDESGREYVAASRSITDTADALNPSANDNLSRAGSPSVSSFTVTDRTNNGQGPRYRIDYAISANGNFSQVQGRAIALGSGGSDSATSTSANGRLDLNPEYGQGSRFRVKLLVFDSDGAVVAVRAQTDTADGN